LVSGEVQKLLPIDRVPNGDHPIFAAGGQAPAVRAERHGIGRAHDVTAVSVTGEDCFPRRQIPDSNGFVSARGGYVIAIGMERYAEYIIRVTAKDLELLAGLHVEECY